ncbi:MAG: Gfo/Idh/MocA family oxidoreductase [Fimbriimonadaceae bacterium]|nr:Gfo/Idh/MocA family oxidoreductase [Fimbriimonadaceae bacterium]
MASEPRARLAFIGCGGFATASIFPNVPFIPEIDLVAVCDLDAAKAERNARNFGARRWYTDLDKMLDTEELDGVFAIGPAPQQYQLAPRILQRGLPVYVEKPSANTSAEARELAELAERHGTWGQCGFMKRFAYVYQMAQDILARQDFGPVKLVSCKFGQGPYPQIWGIDSYKRSFLIGQCVHLFDLVRWFGGHIEAVSALINEAGDGRCAYLANLCYANGAIGQINLNCYENTQGFRDIQERLEVYGAGQCVHVNDMHDVRWFAGSDWSTAVPTTGPFTHDYHPGWTGTSNSREVYGYHGETRHFALRCLGLVDRGPDLWDSYESLRLAEAVYDSAHGAGTVVIPAR